MTSKSMHLKKESVHEKKDVLTKEYLSDRNRFADLREDAYDVIAVLANAAELGVQKKEYLKMKEEQASR
ncbi:hypothetical protein [Ruminococcus gauvreauii]|uniref:hypothetical protein n=1 Tax=Ruminococcus gauvreauii TaxID=438033 RepID=UPI003983E729